MKRIVDDLRRSDSGEASMRTFHCQDDIYKFGIKGAADDAGAYAERVDEQIFVEGILERVFNQISKADVIVADMTGRNPNVFYEVGYAHALNKIVLLLTQDAGDIPSDLKLHPHLVYGGSIDVLRSELSRRIEWGISQSKRSGLDENADKILLTINNTNIPESSLGEEIPTLVRRTTSAISRIVIYIRNNGKRYISEIKPIYLLTEEKSALIPIENIPVDPLVDRIVGQFKGIRSLSNTSDSIKLPGSSKRLYSTKAHIDDCKDGLSEQYFLNVDSYSLAVGEVVRIEFTFLCTDSENSHLVCLRFRLLTGDEYYDYPFNVQINNVSNVETC